MGPSNIIRNASNRIYKYRENNVDLKIITLDSYYKVNHVRESELSSLRKGSNSHGFMRKIISFIAYKSKSSLFFSLITVLKKMIFPAFKLAIKVRQGRELLKFDNIAVVHDCFTAYFLMKFHRKEFSKSKFIFIYHNDGNLWSMLLESYPKLSIFKKYLDSIENSIIARCDSIIMLSNAAKSRLETTKGAAVKNKLKVIYNGIPEFNEKTPTAIYNDNFVNIVCVGTLCRRKGQDRCLDLLSLLPSEMRVKVRLHFIGDGSLREDLNAQSLELGTNEQVFFHGAKDDVYPYIAEADAYILLSRNEGLPLSIIEAMSLGLPILATKVGGVGELVIDGFNGFIHDEDSGSDCLQRFLSLSENKLSKMKLNSRTYYEANFTVNKMIENECKLFKEVFGYDGRS